MELESLPVLNSLVKCGDCGCSTMMNRSLSGTEFRSVKRKFDKEEEKFVVPGVSVPQVARVVVEDEVDMLRETVRSQQDAIQDLCCELEEERNASSSAANEAMSMILRLQREKAELQMESRQFKRFAEEKMAHDQQEISALEEVLYKREQAVESLTGRVQSFKHRLIGYGVAEDELEGDESPGSRMMSRNNSDADDNDFGDHHDFSAYDYPRLKCNLIENHVYSEADIEVPYDVEKYAFGETPRSRGHLKDLEFRINQLEKTSSNIPPEEELFGTQDILQKVVVGQSPGQSSHLRHCSTSSAGTVLKETEFTDSPKFGSIKKGDDKHMEEYTNLKKGDNASDDGEDMTDRVYTIDSIHQDAPYNCVAQPKDPTGFYDDYMTTPKESMNPSDFGNPEIKKMYMRLQALEADRESMRQAIISMRTDKAQFVLLKEIAQHLCKELPSSRSTIVAKPSVFTVYSFISVCKWIVAFIFWKNKARRCRYIFGKSPHNAGLLMLLDKGPHAGHWRCFSRIQM